MSFEIAYYANENFDCPVNDFLVKISAKERAKAAAYMELLAEHGNRLPANYIRHIEGDVWELRPEFGGVEMRLFYFTWVDNLLVIVHALKKKRQKLLQKDIGLARSRVVEVKSGKANIVQELA